MFCHKCGSKIVEGAAFCSECGTKVTVEKDVDTRLIEQEKEETLEHNVETTSQCETNGCEEKRTTNNKGKRRGVIGKAVRGAAVGLAIISFLNPVIIGIILAIAAVIIAVKFRREPKKLIIGIGVIVIAMAVLSLFLNGNKSDKYVEIVKTGTFEQYPQKTVGKAFDDFLEDEVWESGKGENGVRFVNVTGKALYAGEERTLVFQFVIDGEGFSYNACEIDGVPQGDLVVYMLLDAIYSEDISAREANGENRIKLGETQSYATQYNGSMEVTVDYAEFCDKVVADFGFGYDYPDEGSVFLVVGMTVKNIGTTTASFIGSTLVYDGSYQYIQHSYPNDFVNIEPLSAPVSGTITFMVPTVVEESAGSLVLRVDGESDRGGISFNIRTGSNMPENNTTAVATGEDILYLDSESLTYWLGRNINEVVSAWGDCVDETYGYGINYRSYGRVVFYYDAYGEIYGIDCLADWYTINGYDVFDRTSHLELFDIPDDEGYVPNYQFAGDYYEDLYYMTYNTVVPGVGFSVYFQEGIEDALFISLWSR